MRADLSQNKRVSRRGFQELDGCPDGGGMKRCALAKEKDLQPGAPVIVRLFDSRTVQGTICVGGIMETVGGTKIRVRSGHAVYLVNAEQIIGASKGMKREAGND